jgi:hypothetical protein
LSPVFPNVCSCPNSDKWSKNIRFLRSRTPRANKGRARTSVPCAVVAAGRVFGAFISEILRTHEHPSIIMIAESSHSRFILATLVTSRSNSTFSS